MHEEILVSGGGAISRGLQHAYITAAYKGLFGFVATAGFVYYNALLPGEFEMKVRFCVS